MSDYGGQDDGFRLGMGGIRGVGRGSLGYDTLCRRFGWVLVLLHIYYKGIPSRAYARVRARVASCTRA